MDWNNDDLIERSPEHAASTIDGEVVVLQFEEGVYYSMKGVAARIWDLIAEPRTVAAINEALLEEFTVEPEVLRADVATFLADLQKHDLIQVVTEPA